MSQVERFELAPGYSISRLLKGGWHLAGGHGTVEREQAIRDMAAFVEAGITTFDCADHYVGVEELIGEFRRRYPSLAPLVQVHTKYVPDLDLLPTLKRGDTVRIIDRSLQRLGVEQLDCVQFFWWDWSIPGAVETGMVLHDLMREGKIGRLGVTNFNVPKLEALLAPGVPFTVNQLQYSLVDRRPDFRMMEFCRARRIHILTWLGKPEPFPPFTNRSLTKYKLIVEDFGSWDLFQELLATLKRIGERHGVGLGEVAVRWVLDRPGVAGCIVGATSTRHLSRNLAISGIRLTRDDLMEIAFVTDRRRGPPGDCYELENDRTGRHGSIMRYNQNQISTTAAQ